MGRGIACNACEYVEARRTLVPSMSSSLVTEIYLGLGALGAASLATGAFLYASRWPSSRLFGRTLTAPARPSELALTFDDGPNPAWTPQLLDILAAHRAPATFFMVGQFAQAEPALVRRIADAGHLIGNHTWSHPNLAHSSARRIREELTRTHETLQQLTGKPVQFFRPPFGARRPFALRIAQELGMTAVTWNAMTNDWTELSGERIASSLAARIDKNQKRGRATNIVLHDGSHHGLGADREPSVRAARLLLERYALIRRFVTLDSWV
jgi:peptidoglycan/xylan/chitin deacetylase (PgdA/CDA1 family)